MASVRLVDNARLIGMIELMNGIKMPIAKAYVVEYALGIKDGMKPRSSWKRIL